jgi:hypothetical protein
MPTITRKIKCALLIGLVASAAGCIVEQPRYHDGYWDREHARYWYGGGWHPCAEHGEYCR